MRALLPAALLLSLSACDSGKPAPASPPSNAAASSSPAPAGEATPGGLVRVTDASLVCMVNDQFMGRPQIPVPVAGRTYYGCCENCKTKLANDETARMGTDPVSGERVDKATAVIGQEPSGKVHYFASEANLGRFAATQKTL